MTSGWANPVAVPPLAGQLAGVLAGPPRAVPVRQDGDRRPAGVDETIAPVPSRAAIDELYLAFADCSLAEAMGYCSYCDTAEYEQALHGDLRMLPPELVDKYIWDAIHHTGDVSCSPRLRLMSICRRR